MTAERGGDVKAERDALAEEVRQLRAVLPPLAEFLAHAKRLSIMPLAGRAEFLRRWVQALMEEGDR